MVFFKYGRIRNLISISPSPLGPQPVYAPASGKPLKHITPVPPPPAWIQIPPPFPGCEGEKKNLRMPPGPTCQSQGARGEGDLIWLDSFPLPLPSRTEG